MTAKLYSLRVQDKENPTVELAFYCNKKGEVDIVRLARNRPDQARHLVELLTDTSLPIPWIYPQLHSDEYARNKVLSLCGPEIHLEIKE